MYWFFCLVLGGWIVCWWNVVGIFVLWMFRRGVCKIVCVFCGIWFDGGLSGNWGGLFVGWIKGVFVVVVGYVGCVVFVYFRWID